MNKIEICYFKWSL